MNVKLIFSICSVAVSSALVAQEGLPPNPKPGQCYVRCVEEDVWRETAVTVTERPGYVKLEKVPAEYVTEEIQVLVKPAFKKLEIVPAVFKKVKETIQVEDNFNRLTIIPAKFTTTIEEVVVQPSFSRFESKVSNDAACKGKNSAECRVLCYVEYPEQRTPINVQKVEAATTTSATLVPGRTTEITKDELVSAATVREIEVPAVYKTVKKRTLVRDETVREVEVPPVFVTQSTRVLEKQGGESSWEEIDCKLVDPNILPIFYDLNSARLTKESKEVIDEKLYKLMTEKPKIRVEINSHTDSRDSDNYNLELSQRRAQSVVDYLVSKGIRSSRLIAKGFGESRLKEPCPNDVECTEDQHAKNRRTEFRVLTN